jgi:hypothetical protein
MIRVDYEKVRSLANTLRALRLAPDFAEQLTPRMTASPESALRAFLWASTICHSTKGGLKGTFNGVEFKGWDYLLRAFCVAADNDEALVSPEAITKLSDDRLLKILLLYATNGEVSLSDIDRRAEILRTCASQLTQVFQGSVNTLLERANNKVGGDSGAYSQLALLDAFQDPLVKKSSAFLMTVHFSGLWTITDQEHVQPMIDYHRMRLLCRTGCIEIRDSDTLHSLISQTPISPQVETAIREAAAEVCKSVVKFSQIPMFECDVLIWAHARSCCRHFPLCVSNRLENSSFYQYISNPYVGTCEFQAWCQGNKESTVRGIWEPKIFTERY